MKLVNPSYDFVKPRREGKQFSSFNDSYHRVKDIGNGAFGVVFLAICKTSGKRVAVKQVQLSDKLDVAETKKRVALLREISVFMAFPAHVRSFFFFAWVWFISDFLFTYSLALSE